MNLYEFMYGFYCDEFIRNEGFKVQVRGSFGEKKDYEFFTIKVADLETYPLITNAFTKYNVFAFRFDYSERLIIASVLEHLAKPKRVRL